MFDALSHRNRGLLLLFLSLTMVVLDVVLVRGPGIFYRFLLPFALFVAPLGIYMAATDRGADDFRSGRTPADTVRMLVSLMVMSAAFGFIGNRLLAGRPW